MDGRETEGERKKWKIKIFKYNLKEGKGEISR
jgi:hypothetical protein